ncbi:MAG: helix-hairpin-helix domain-containing protein [Bacteroidales bacterium]
MRRFFKTYFIFSKRERNGLLVLMFIILILLAYQLFQLSSSEEIYDTDVEFMTELEILAKKFQVREQDVSSRDDPDNYEDYLKDNLFAFDPNTAELDEFIRLGLSDAQASVIINYRKSGGVFRDPEDFKKIYSISAHLYEKLKPYISISITGEEKATGNKEVSLVNREKENNTVNMIEINNSREDSLVNVIGIPGYLANRTMKYRELLGGYYSKQQYNEIFGMNHENLDRLKSLTRVDTTLIRKIDLGSADIKALERHPYINDYQAKSIMNYLKIMGNIKDIKELLDNNILDSATYQKILPYIYIGEN